MVESTSNALCGLWATGESEISESFVSGATEDRTVSREPFAPFVWASSPLPDAACRFERLEGRGFFPYLLRFEGITQYREAVRQYGKDIFFEHIRSPESQYLLQHRKRMFAGMKFGQLRRCQLDIETACSVEGGFSNARRKEDRILAIGMAFSPDVDPVLLTLNEMTDLAERELLMDFCRLLEERDPDVIEGHNIFSFDLEYLRLRSQKLKVPCRWGRFGQEITHRKSRLRVAERWIDFKRFDLPGRTVFDTYLAIQIYDVTARELLSYGLKDVAVHLGVTSESGSERTYLKGHEIQGAYFNDREAFLAYLSDDLRETRGLANLLLPTYFAQVQDFPMTLQDVYLRGTASKVDLLLHEKYYHAKQSLPASEEVTSFEGGYSRSFEEGVYKHVLHYDVASLYPSLLLAIGRNPKGDTLGIFIKMLQELREYRLKYKELARTAVDEELRAEYNARQTSFKILINSFYGYLGFNGARFADSELAAEITRNGRELLQKLIAQFEKEGVHVLEADTDGIYLSSEKYFEDPDALLEKVIPILPEGIELEFDGKYPAMFCYKAKNYALYDSNKIIIRGSALRSRGTEPFLKELTDQLIHFLLGLKSRNPLDMVEEMRVQIMEGKFDVKCLAKSEYLSQSPEAYKKKVEDGNKQRRASLEVALRMKQTPKMGDRVTYYISIGKRGEKSDWQRALPLEQYNPKETPYDRNFYVKKLDDWIERYGSFLGVKKEIQSELF